MATVRGTIDVKIDTCKGCELCIEACPQESMALSKELNTLGYHYAVLVQDNCTGCTICAQHCPAEAIEATPFRIHEIDNDKCTRCDVCRVDCPEGAIAILSGGMKCRGHAPSEHMEHIVVAHE